MKLIYRKVIYCLVLVSFVFGLMIAVQPQNAYAVADTEGGEAADEVGDQVTKVQDKVEKKIGASFKTAGRIAARNAINTFLTKIAYDTAVWLASGGQGQRPKLFTKDIGSYLGSAALNAGADFVQTFASEFADFDVCNVNLDPNLKISIAVGLGREIKPREPDCSWQELAGSWKRVVDDINAIDLIPLSFNPTQSDLGVALLADQNLYNTAVAKKGEKALERQINGWIEDTISPVTGFIETPAGVNRAVVEERLAEAGDPNKIITDDWYADALTVFTNTLVSRGLTNIMNGLIKNFTDDDLDIDEILRNI